MIRVLTLIAALGVLSSCGAGRVFQNTVLPLDLNLDETPVVSRYDNHDQADVKIFRYYVEFDWDSNAIGEIANKAGFREIYYADLETLSILGIWTQQIVHVYGVR